MNNGQYINNMGAGGQVVKMRDNATSMFRDLNRRNALNKYSLPSSVFMTYEEQKSYYNDGIGRRIIDILTNYSLREGFIFDSDNGEEVYNQTLKAYIYEAVSYMFAFGRGVIAIIPRDLDEKDLLEPLSGELDISKCTIHVFDADEVSVVSNNTDLKNERYYKPQLYTIRGIQYHYSRIVDFTYKTPTFREKPNYYYGGISEFQYIKSQILSKAINTNLVPTVADKQNAIYYKVKGFSKAITSRNRDQESGILRAYSLMEDRRSQYGAGIIDAEDDVVNVQSTLQGLLDSYEVTTKDLSFITGIPRLVLDGGEARGLSNQDNEEMTIFQSLISTNQDRYIIKKVMQLFAMFGLGSMEFNKPDEMTTQETAEWESKLIENAERLYQLGYDIDAYFKSKGFDVEKSSIDIDNEFPSEEEDES